MDERVPNYKWSHCFVPKCKNTMIQNPNKVFLYVPQGQKMRKKWMKAVRRDSKDITANANYYVCEDHFDLENDMKNYVRWKLMGGKKYLKKGVIPHKFDCQKDRKRKRKRLQMIKEAEEKLVIQDVDIAEHAYLDPAMTSRTESDTHIHNPMDDIQKDEWYHFGNNIACQLRNLPLERALMCQQKIIEILTQERIDCIVKVKTEDTNTTKDD